MIEKNNQSQENPTPSLLNSLKAGFASAPVFTFLEKFDAFFKKKKRILSQNEVLFEPGENPYFFIVASGALGVYRVNPSGEQKEIGRVYAGGFIGE